MAMTVDFKRAFYHPRLGLLQPGAYSIPEHYKDVLPSTAEVLSAKAAAQLDSDPVEPREVQDPAAPDLVEPVAPKGGAKK